MVNAAIVPPAQTNNGDVVIDTGIVPSSQINSVDEDLRADDDFCNYAVDAFECVDNFDEGKHLINN